MKISEIISEAKSKIRKGSAESLPDMETYADLDNNNNPYLAYRFGVALAVSPDDHVNPQGPFGSKFITIGYTDADNKIIQKAKKIVGVKSDSTTSSGSKELSGVNTQSPMQPKGRVTRRNK